MSYHQFPLTLWLIISRPVYFIRKIRSKKKEINVVFQTLQLIWSCSIANLIGALSFFSVLCALVGWCLFLPIQNILISRCRNFLCDFHIIFHCLSVVLQFGLECFWERWMYHVSCLQLVFPVHRSMNTKEPASRDVPGYWFYNMEWTHSDAKSTIYITINNTTIIAIFRGQAKHTAFLPLFAVIFWLALRAREQSQQGQLPLLFDLSV